jgi:hypothetical protein
VKGKRTAVVVAGALAYILWTRKAKRTATTSVEVVA